MNVSCQELRSRAWNKLKGNYWDAFIASLVTSLLGTALPFILTGPTTQGQVAYYLSLSRGEKPDIGLVLQGFGHFILNLLTYLLMSLFLFLWSLLLFVPGIIKSLSYALTYFVITENPELSPSEAITQSRQLMDGHKWKLFCLNLSFIGWYLLGTLLLGFGNFFVLPYVQASIAEFYQEVKRCNVNQTSTRSTEL